MDWVLRPLLTAICSSTVPTHTRKQTNTRGNSGQSSNTVLLHPPPPTHKKQTVWNWRFEKKRNIWMRGPRILKLKIVIWKHLGKYMWVKKCVKIRAMLFKNWKLLFENTNQTLITFTSYSCFLLNRSCNKSLHLLICDSSFLWLWMTPLKHKMSSYSYICKLLRWYR